MVYSLDRQPVKKILLVAFHFPPIKGSSGLHRTLSLAKYLMKHSWQPAVLTASSKAYEITSDELLSEIPQDLLVKQAFALDTTRHLSFKGRYFQWWALPDRWVSWWFGAVFSAVKLIRKFKPDLLWSTYPIATSHLIGLTLYKLTKLPWIADFRDSMTEEDYPRHPLVRSVYRWIEKATVNNACKVVFTTYGALQMYSDRYPEINKNKWVVIENGVDEDFFCKIEKTIDLKQIKKNQKLKLLHSGILYPDERNPIPFFHAVKKLKKNNKISATTLEIVLRSSTNEKEYRKNIKELAIDDIVFFEPGIPYADAIEEMILADGLLIFQSSGCNHQIPAKIYEYFRCGRPILGLTDPKGNTAQLLKGEQGTLVSTMNDQNEIEEKLVQFIDYCRANQLNRVRKKSDCHSRESRVVQYVKLFNSISQIKI